MADTFKDIKQLYSLAGRNYIVTGGAQGIGFAVTQAICQMGGNVAVLDIRTEPVEAYKSLSSQFNVKTEYFQTDVTKEEDLKSSFEKAIASLGSLDGLVPVAGIVVDKPFVEQTWEKVNRIQQTNVMGTFFATQLAVKQMLKQGTPGSIVLVASLCATQTTPGHRVSGYHASKGAVLMLAKGLAVELAPQNIRVNSISPGYTESDMTRKLREQYPQVIEVMHKVAPMKRIGNVNDLTPAVVYLLSDAAAYTTSADIQITGGLHAGRIEPNSLD
ncbi:hypothetical protein PMZ80_000122 [Knufia obscura]|uniref:Uncharacterized protein n=1 Tax=Knufia obscura TaxID=1635080 RepID=A0ABR0S0E9_9EURO|nr:hypothetical protein PMZ80_000122 [Knufia obscura]